MTKQQAFEVVAELIKRTPISFVESFGVVEAMRVLKAASEPEVASTEGTVPFKAYQEPKE